MFDFEGKNASVEEMRADVDGNVFISFMVDEPFELHAKASEFAKRIESSIPNAKTKTQESLGKSYVFFETNTRSLLEYKIKEMELQGGRK